MSFRRFCVRLAVVFIFIMILNILYRRHMDKKERHLHAFVPLMKTSRDKANSEVYSISDITKETACKYSIVNYTMYNFDQFLHPFFTCVPLYTLSGFIPICVHDKTDESAVQNIRQMGQEEASVMEDVEQILRNNAGYDLVDIGSNIGIYSLLAANLKRLVLAVEPMEIYYRIFHQTVILNRVEALITLVAGSPLMDEHKSVELTVINNGSTSWTHYSVSAHTQSTKHRIVQKKLLNSIMMDDLVNAVPFDKAVMVINLDGNEAAAFKGGQRFFSCHNIVYVFLEWSKSLLNDKRYILDFFSERNYTAHAWTTDTQRLSFESYHKWPPNIVWKKNSK